VNVEFQAAAVGEPEGSWRTRSTAASPLRRYAIVGAILALGLACRVAWMVTEASVISSDGGEYAAMAEHLRHQHALIGTYEGPEILYAPLYPLLIAATMAAIPNSERAAHVVSLVSGTALIAVLFLIAQRVYGRRTAHVTAALAAVNPMLVALSASIYNEALYLTIWMALAYWGMRALDLRRLRDALLLGVCVGLAYLTRVEAIVYVPFLAAAVWTAGVRLKKKRAAGVHAVALCAVCFLLASPYMWFFYRHTDRLRFEAKSDINYTMARNRLAGMSVMEADWGLKRDLTIEGPLLGPFEFADFTPYSHTVAERLRALASMAKLNAHATYHLLVERQFGSLIVWALVIVGWCRRSWSNRRLRDEAILCAMAGSIVIVTLISATGEVRYLFTIMPVLVLWSANGLQELAVWVIGSEFITTRFHRWKWIAPAVQLGVAAVIVAISVGGIEGDGYFANEHSPEAAAARDAGLWLARNGFESKRLAVRLPVVPYYAKGTLIAFPCGDPDVTLQYLARRRVDFVVLESAEAQVLPTIGEWIEHGIPDPRARLVYDKTSTAGVRVVIYQWGHT
jgi:4-amino-4-deoxy-L-arabinose transferase-like glycosyltransferase